MIPRMLQLGYGIDNLALLADQLAGRRPRTELGTRAAGGIAWLSVPVESGVITDMPDEAQLLSIFGGHRGQDRHAARGLQQGFARCDVSRGVRFLHRRQPAGRRRVRQIRPTCLPHRRRPRGMKVCVRPEPTEKVVNFCEADSAEDYQTRTTMIRVDADGADMRDIRAQHQLRSVRAAAMLRIAVVGLMVGAMLLGTRVEEWFAQSVLLVCYAAGAIWAAAFAFCGTGPSSTKQTLQIAIAVGDVAAIAIFELLSSGGYTPLAVMAFPLRVAKASAPILAANGGGAFVNMHSALSWLSGGGAYGASKAAMWSLSNSLRDELASQHTQVLGVHAAFLDTDMTAGLPVPKTSPQVAAARIIDALEAGAAEVLVDDASVAAKAALSGPVENLSVSLPV
jgi:NAD(P)-dependent dehydrogenase (short-subunit alcohol dehydrogenase family)